ncbi:MAG: caspase family protein [Chlorobiaceae bacterium]|nr:caspase family protein [Chlorobiaceae bacterium]
MKKSIFTMMIAAILTTLAVPAYAVAQKKALIVYHNDWGGAPNALKMELQGRGYTVTLTDNASQGLTALSNLSNTLASGDNLLVYLAGHGSDPRINRNDISKATAASHFVQFNSGILYVSQTAPLFEKIANKGVSLKVIDGSCNGGESVLYGMGQKYTIMSTTGVYSPGLTSFPAPSNAISKDSKPGAFGLWWEPHQTASWMNGEIVSYVPERINQRLFRNDNTDIANLSLFLRPSIGILTSLDLGGWNLHYQYCYLYRFIYPDDYATLDASEKSKFTNSYQTYIDSMHSYYNPSAQFYNKLDSYLSNSSLLNSAAAVYASNYDKAWKTLANDPTWNVTGDPGKYASKMKGITPDAYTGSAGFLKMAGEIDFLMTVLQTGYAQQEALLSQIDAAAKDTYGPAKIAELVKLTPVKRSWPPEPGESVNKFNLFERSVMRKVDLIDNQLRIDRRTLLMRPTQMAPINPNLIRVSGPRRSEAENTLNLNVQKYQSSFKTTVSAEKVGISAALIDSMKKQKLEELIGKFKAISPTLYYAEGRISFLLSIVEDAIGKVQGAGSSSQDQL